MKHHLPSLDNLKVFEAAARLLSFTRAAEELCITKGAVSYQIKQLEQRMGCALFRRSTRQVFLTDEGQTLFQTTVEVFDRIGKAVNRIQSSRREDVSIAATTYVAARWLSPRVAKFLEHRPNVSVRFYHGVNDPGFQFEQADISIVWGRCGAIRRQNSTGILPMPLFPVVNKEQAQRLKDNPAWLDDITLLSEPRSQDLWQEWFASVESGNPRQVIEDANVRVQAAIDGQGMILADAMMQNELDSGVLVAPFSKTLDGYGYQLKTSWGTDASQLVGEMMRWLQADMTRTNAADPADLLS